MAPSRISPHDVSRVSEEASPDYFARPVTKKAAQPANRTVGTPKPWVGSQLTESDYLVIISDEEILEIEEAAKSFIASEIPIGSISAQIFYLPTLGIKLAQLKQRLHSGLGFFVLRGLRPKKYDNITNIVIHAGISSHIGNRRAVKYSTNQVLTHVVDLSSEEDRKMNEGKYLGSGNSNEIVPFHTDRGHILCLYSIHSASVGGRSKLASGAAIVQQLHLERPEMIKLLKDDWEWDTFSVVGSGKLRPLLFEEDGRTFLNYSRRPLCGTPNYPRRAHLSPLSSVQIETLDKLEDLASDMSLTFNFCSGDIQYVNNMAVLHGREPFQNEWYMGCRRHLLRLFLKDDENDVPLPEPLKDIVAGFYDHKPEDEGFPWSLAPLEYDRSP